ncbi:phosphoribosylanthranilate isomerase [Streptococcus dysgalactiae subsp. equisimilis]|nr:phosphoribosylanthranilate isomerase [Streptococcus dysgalactiae subsp. equisimilis]VGR68835.1 phosphoribosylanthranilate isomerase [Streptococcus pyogenes]SQF77072.1 phosphoribosylanthranilate isomerase [Streptococcus dysgalactiae subsp. equisimilis]VGV58142.1 phosphoribosylanthranilate isomerase [Streptococcus pyogenes]VGV66749.1 phosphoribosylanthranilate isomerase [Streptococcus pyogenes]
MNEHLHKEFLKIVSEMNKLNIIPLLLGSFGLEKVTNKSW